ncbi:MAG: helix-turn-helix domain-containing protein [Acholeplasmataceae bacterium]
MKDNRSVNRILSILELISKHPDGLTLGEIYRTLDMPKATAYDFLQTLYKADAIYYKDPFRKTYVIGSKMYAIGSVYTKNSNFITTSAPLLKEFSDEHGCNSFVTKRIGNDKIVFVHTYQSPNSQIVSPMDVGTVYNSFLDTHIGRCYAAFDKKIQPSIKLNEEEVTEILNQGYVMELSGDLNHMVNIAIPIYNFENRCCGVVSYAALHTSAEDTNKLAKHFLEVGDLISRRLGYLGEYCDY